MSSVRRQALGIAIDDWAVGWNPPTPGFDNRVTVSVRRAWTPGYREWQRKFFCVLTAKQLGDLSHADKVAHLTMQAVYIAATGIDPKRVYREFYRIEAFRRVARAQVCGMLVAIGTESPAAMKKAEANRQRMINGIGGEFLL